MSGRNNMAPDGEHQFGGSKDNSSSAAKNGCATNGADTCAAPTQRTNLKENRQPPTIRRPSSSVSILSGVTGQASQKQHKLKSRFTVIRKLGKGTYGKVQLAINKETGQEVAIKTIKKTKIENEQDLQRVKREIQIMSSIEHPHIIHIYEVFENKDKIVLIMQYAPGGELYEYVSQSKVLDDSEARRLFRQIATAIYYCHQNKICHRDLKLENILLDEKNNAKLADFGLSNVFDKSRLLKTFCGSPLYASPEIVQGSPYEGPEVDCWSLGVLLYTLVYGAMPFDGSNFKRLVKQISGACYYEPAQKSHASPLISRLLCADPQKRANILDICSDPWVNGLMVPRSPTNQSSSGDTSQSTNQQSHASLMKVAQDMASLTPVRLDILLALAPTKQELPPPAKLAAIPLRETVMNTENATKGMEKSATRPIIISSLDPNLMDVDDENRATSPVASYIVRDLDDMKETAEKPGQNVQDNGQKEEDMEPEVRQVQRELDNTKTKSHEQTNQESVEMSIEPQQDAKFDEKIPDIISSVPDSQKRDAAEVENQNSDGYDPIGDHTTMMESDNNTAILSTELASNIQQADESSMEVDQASRKSEPVGATGSVNEPLPQESAMDIEAKVEIKPRSEEEAENNEQQVKQESTIEANDANDANLEPTTQGEKPKKVKKRIVVVKRKKKVVKRDTDAQKDGQEVDSNEPSSEKTKHDPNVNIDQAVSTKSVSGKVKIPETFRAAATPSPPPPKTPTVGRRQSALIADVSQRLLQQQQQQVPVPSASAIEDDLQQLAGVRVSDKKEEFERRTSLANDAVATEPAKAAHKTSIPQPEQQPDYEPKLAESRKESLNVVCSIQQTIVEPVKSQHHPQLTKEISLDPSLEYNSEPITPTGSVQEQRLEFPERAAECAGLQNNSEQSENLSPPVDIRDDRSDSMDTIRAEIADSPQLLELEQESPRPTIRSSLQIDLASNNPNDPVVQPQRNPQSRNKSPLLSLFNVGPAPIARSYKKVTFTKDGTCVTETGKIYSTQGEDGTVRRIERKSKVTHYPDNGASEATACEEIQEEVTYENRGQPLIDSSSKLWPGQSRSSFKQDHPTSTTSAATHAQLRPFERLVMPATEMFSTSNILDDQFEVGRNESNNDELNSWRAKQAAYQQSGRADSASSCSSGSTDVFDDTFDTWTGAISMFNQSHRLSNFDSLVSRALGAHSPLNQSIFSNSRQGGQRHQAGGSLAGTPLRCESVEPPHMWNHRHQRGKQRRHQQGSSEQSGYESDVPSNRPASATLGNVRGPTFGSSNLFPRVKDSLFEDAFPDADGGLFGRNLFHDIELEHERLRSKIAKQHKQLWKGSTPSLIGFQEPQPRNKNREHVSTTTRVSLPGENQSQTRPLRQSVPLSSEPQRHRTVSSDKFQPLPPRQSTSRTSLIANQLAQIRLASNPGDSNTEPPGGTTQRVASFIELKRSPSKTSSINQDKPRNIQVEAQKQSNNKHQVPGKSDAFVSQTSDMSSAFWDGRVSPNVAPVSANSRESQSNVSENPDSRVRNWLQQSSGNLSISSGSRSSASETIASSCRSDPSSQMFAPDISSRRVELHDASNQQQPHHHQLPPAPSRSPNRQKQPSSQASQQHHQQVVYSKVIRSSSRQSAGNESNENVSAGNKIREEHTIISTGEQINRGNQVVSRMSSSEFRLAQQQQKSEPSQMISPRLLDDDVDGWRDMGSRPMFMQQQTKLPPSQPSTAPIRETGDSLSWHHSLNDRDQQQVTAGQQRSIFIGDNDIDDSLSGSGADLESRSSSSLLEQLRQRGYRSMITQRMGAHQPQPVSTVHFEEHQTSSQVVTATSSGASLSTSGASMPRAITNTQMILSSSAAVTEADGDAQMKTLRRTISSQHKSRLIQDTLEKVEHRLLAKNDGGQITVSEAKGTIEPNELDNQQSNADLEETNQVINRSNDSPDLVTLTGENQVDQAADDATNDGVQQDEDDIDEDVRDAKANIKEYLDRMRETEKFLKSLHEEEENQEKQRQQLFIFNNLMLNTKLNGIRLSTQSNNYSDSNVSSSAPIWNDNTYGITNASELTTSTLKTTINQSLDGDVFHRPMHNGFRNLTNSTMLESHNVAQQPLESIVPKSTSCFSSDLYEPVNSYYSSTQHRDPLEPVQPYNMTSSFGSKHVTTAPSAMRSWYRSKSQLSDQFYGNEPVSSSSCYSKYRRPLSASINQNSLDQNPYFPTKSRRSVSQIRTSVSTVAPSFSLTHRTDQSMMSEYRSSFGPNLQSSAHSPVRRRATSPITTISDSTLTTVGSTRKLSTEDVASSDESDAGMRDYRASSYVPKVVPESSPVSFRNSRDSRRRSLYKPTATLGARSDLNSVDYSRSSPHRRTSLQSATSCVRGRSTERSVSPAVRRQSLIGVGMSSGPLSDRHVDQGPSRLSELEQRIQANKRRREELLKGNYDKCSSSAGEAIIANQNSRATEDLNDRTKAKRASSLQVRHPDAHSDSDDESTFERPPLRMRSSHRAVSPSEQSMEHLGDTDRVTQPTPTSRFGAKARCSRLESMEARIKRRSYCVRTNSPERPKTRPSMSSANEGSLPTAKRQLSDDQRD